MLEIRLLEAFKILESEAGSHFVLSNLISKGASHLILNPLLQSLKCSKLTHKSNSIKSKFQVLAAIAFMFA